MGVFTFFKQSKWYQITERITTYQWDLSLLSLIIGLYTTLNLIYLILDREQIVIPILQIIYICNHLQHLEISIASSIILMELYYWKLT